MSEQNYGITLVCFNCGNKTEAVVTRLPQFAFELADIANQAGMYGVIDMYRGRSLVFCNEECSEQAKTKKGTYKLRSKVKS